MRVILVPAAQSPVRAPVNGVTNQDASNDTPEKEKVLSGFEKHHSSDKVQEALVILSDKQCSSRGQFQFVNMLSFPLA